MRDIEADTGERVGAALAQIDSWIDTVARGAAPAAGHRRSDLADIAVGMLVSGATTAATLLVLLVLAILALPGPPRPTLGP